MSSFCGVMSILGVGQSLSYPVFAVQRFCPSSSHLYTREKKCYLSIGEKLYSFQNVKQTSRSKSSQTRWCKSIKCKEKNPDNDCGPENDGVSQATLIWRAIKLPIYSVAVVPLTVASAAAYLQTGQFSVGRYLGLLVSSIFIITWLNLSNDVYDFDTGADKNKKESVVNILGSRMGTLVAAILLLAFGFAGLIWVALVAGNMRSILLLLCAVLCGYVYQCPPFRLSYQGLGEPLCFAAFGPFATTAFYLLQIISSKGGYYFPLTSTVLSASVLVGYTTTLILFCSHFHQVEGDRAVGKFSPLVRIGQKTGAEVVKFAIVGLYCALFVLSLGNILPLTSTILCALTLPVGRMVFRYMEDNYHFIGGAAEVIGNGQFLQKLKFNRSLLASQDNEKIFMAKYYCVRLHTLFGVALAAGLVAARRFGNYAPRPIFR